MDKKIRFLALMLAIGLSVCSVSCEKGEPVKKDAIQKDTAEETGVSGEGVKKDQVEEELTDEEKAEKAWLERMGIPFGESEAEDYQDPFGLEDGEGPFEDSKDIESEGGDWLGDLDEQWPPRKKDRSNESQK